MTNYTFTRNQLNTLLFATIDMLIEFRDVHGHEEDGARFEAVDEMFQGLDAEREMVASGELKKAGGQLLDHRADRLLRRIVREYSLSDEEARGVSTMEQLIKEAQQYLSPDPQF